MMNSVEAILSGDTEELRRAGIIGWAKNPANRVKLIIAFSGGKDSVAMVLYLLSLGFDKDSIELWHHDVDGDGEQLFDWPCTKSYCQCFADAFGLKILFSYAKGGILLEIYRTNETVQPVFFQKQPGGRYTEIKPQDKERFYNTRRRFPAVSADLNVRWCSWIAKISVMLKGINHSERYTNANMIIMTGERRLESAARRNYKEMELYRGASNTRRAIQWRPLIDWTEQQVWDIFRFYGVQPHPCYELGWNRCSCQLCIFSNANTWAAINEISPGKVERIAEIEKDLDHSLYNEFEKIPIGRVWQTGKRTGMEIFEKGKKIDNVYQARVIRGTSFIPAAAKQRWMDEALGEFISPIIIDNWKLPAGAFSMETAGAN